MSYFIPISQLNQQTNIYAGDFFPMVTSSSLTTYKVNLQTLQNFLQLPQISASWVSRSVSSSYSLTASYPTYPQISASWASQSISSSYSITASWAPFAIQTPQISCSLATNESVSSSYALTASWSPTSQVFYVSMSWASQSISSSYSITASYAPFPPNVSPFVFLSTPVVVIPYTIMLTSNVPNNVHLYTKNFVCNGRPGPPYTRGVILQSNTDNIAGNNGTIFASSSVMPLLPIGGIAHSFLTPVFFANVGNDNLLYILIFGETTGAAGGGSGDDILNASVGLNIIGYY